MNYLDECLASGETLLARFRLSLVAWDGFAACGLIDLALWNWRWVAQWAANSDWPGSQLLAMVLAAPPLSGNLFPNPQGLAFWDQINGIIPWFSPGLRVVLGLYATYRFLTLWCMEFGLTTARAIRKTGIVARRTEEVRLTAIETVDLHQGIFGRLLGYGDVLVTGRGASLLVFRRIRRPIRVKRAIEEACLQNTSRQPEPFHTSPPQTPATPSSVESLPPTF